MQPTQKTNPLFFGDTALGWVRWDKKAIKRAWSVGAISHNVPLAWRSVRHEHFAKPKLCDVALCVGKPFGLPFCALAGWVLFHHQKRRDLFLPFLLVFNACHVFSSG
jgi:hypothetical protein